MEIINTAERIIKIVAVIGFMITAFKILSLVTGSKREKSNLKEILFYIYIGLGSLIIAVS